LLLSNQKSNKNVHNAVILYSTTWASELFMAKNHPFLWTSLQAARGKITVSDIPNHLNYCAVFTVFSHFTHVAMGSIIQLDRLRMACRPWVGDLFSTMYHNPSTKMMEQNLYIFQGSITIHLIRTT
jgi:hypothetical protein